MAETSVKLRGPQPGAMKRKSMKRRWAVVSIVVAAIIAGGGFLSEEGEPEHGGKSVSEWLEVYQKRRVDDGLIGPTGGPADEAIRAMGANAIPYILVELRAEDSRLEALRLRLFRRQSLIRLRTQSADVRRAAACGALMAADSAASGFGAPLMELMESPDEMVQYYAAMSLVHCDSEEAVEALVRQLDDGKIMSQAGAAQALERLTNAPASVISALTRALERANPQVRLQSAVTLRAYGGRANSAAPALRRRLEDGKDINWNAFATTLHSVDPENAHETLVPTLIERSSNGADRRAQLASIRLLGHLGAQAKAALPELRALLEVDDVAVRRFVKSAIRKITGEASR